MLGFVHWRHVPGGGMEVNIHRWFGLAAALLYALAVLTLALTSAWRVVQIFCLGCPG
jgi:hypothetical protein